MSTREHVRGAFDRFTSRIGCLLALLPIGAACLLAAAELLKVSSRIAGKANNVSTVATTRPPMMATAIGPQKTERDNGIMASTAAAAVKTMGRRRRTADSTMASQAGTPRARA
jgi:hypothetical protein